MTPEAIQGWLQVGVAGILLAALFFGNRRIWVFGWTFKDSTDQYEERLTKMAEEYEARLARERKEKEEWKQMALHNLQLTTKLTEVGERIAERTTSE